MKLLVVLCAAVACAVAKPGFAYSSIAAPSLVGAHGWVGPALSRTIVGPGIASSVLSAPGLVGTGLVGHGLAAPGLTYAAQAYAAPIAQAYAAPVAHAYAAPAIAAPVVAAPAIAAAPVVAAPAIAHAAVAAPVVAAAPAVTKTQYHAQNELGEASYGHSEPLQTHNAVQDAHGNKVGSFSYLNPHDGQVHRTDYVADAHGYRVAANDLPAAPAVVPVHAIHRRSVVVSHTPLLTQTPGSTALLAHGVAPAAVAAPLAYSAGIAAPLAYSAGIAAPLAYSAGVAAPLAYSAGIAAPLAVAPAVHGIPATLTTITNNPGHAVSYRVD